MRCSVSASVRLIAPLGKTSPTPPRSSLFLGARERIDSTSWVVCWFREGQVASNSGRGKSSVRELDMIIGYDIAGFLLGKYSLPPIEFKLKKKELVLL